MGQQQLLLLVLGIVIVGLAVVVGITAFEENSFRARQDQYTAEAAELAAAVVAWQSKPTIFGGNEHATDFSGLSFAGLGLDGAPLDGGSFRDANGARYVVDGSGAVPEVRVFDEPSEAGDVLVEIALHGMTQGCWATRTRYHDGAAFVDPTGSLDTPDASCSW